MKKIYNKQAFTLVELIVVITILAVLGTIAIMAFSGYSKNARDSARVSDLTNIKKALELWITQAGTYPNPSESEDITFSGGLVWKQGTFGETVHNTIGKLDKKPTDPLFGVEYTYSVTSTKKEYQLGAVLEKNLGYSNPIVTQTYAADPVKAFVLGNYNGIIATINANPSYIIALPSILLSDIESMPNRELTTTNSGTIVLQAKSNLPSSYNGIGFTMNGGDFSFNPVVVWSGSTLSLLDNQGEFQSFVVNLQNAYKNNDAFTNLPEYTQIVNESESSEVAMKYAKNIIEASTKKELKEISVIPNFSCASETGYVHANHVSNSPSQMNQAWQNANPSGGCYYTCTDGYSGNDCSIPPSPITITFSNPENEIVACSLCTAYNP